MKNDIDKLSRYEVGRYISSSEPAWPILYFPKHEMFPSVMNLAVHRNNVQRVYFTDANITETIQNVPQTTLLEFLNLL